MTNNEHIYRFLKELSANNNREWFKERKEAFDEMRAMWMNDVAQLIRLMADYDSNLVGLDVKSCVYRIYRDVRFSNDKSPYKTYFSAVIGRDGRKCKRAGYYLHLQPGNSGLHAGVWWPEADVLRMLRHSVADNVDEFLEILGEKKFSEQYKFHGETLKKLPRDFAKDTPHPELIKMKEYLCLKTVPDSYFFDDNWVEKVAEDYRIVKPFTDFLNYAFEEDAYE